MSTKKKLCSIKGLSEAKVDKIKEVTVKLSGVQLNCSVQYVTYCCHNSTFRKIFSTRSQDVVEMCKQIFGCQTTSDVVAHRKCRLLSKFIVSDNMLCQVVKDVAMDELTLLNRAVS